MAIKTVEYGASNLGLNSSLPAERLLAGKQIIKPFLDRQGSAAFMKLGYAEEETEYLEPIFGLLGNLRQDGREGSGWEFRDPIDSTSSRRYIRLDSDRPGLVRTTFFRASDRYVDAHEHEGTRAELNRMSDGLNPQIIGKLLLLGNSLYDNDAELRQVITQGELPPARFVSRTNPLAEALKIVHLAATFSFERTPQEQIPSDLRVEANYPNGQNIVQLWEKLQSADSTILLGKIKIPK